MAEDDAEAAPAEAEVAHEAEEEKEEEYDPFGKTKAEKKIDELTEKARAEQASSQAEAASVSEVWHAYNRFDVHAIVRQMEAGLEDAFLVREGCDALGMLAASSNRQALVDLAAETPADAAGLVVKAMDGHLEAVDVQRRGCQALGRLARYGGLAVRQQLARAHAAAAVLRAMDEHMLVNAVQKDGSTALAYLLQFVGDDIPERADIKKATAVATDPFHGEDPESVHYKQRIAKEEAAGPGRWKFDNVPFERAKVEGERAIRAYGIFGPPEPEEEEEEKKPEEDEEEDDED